MGADIGRIPEDTVRSRPNGAGSQPQSTRKHPRAADLPPAGPRHSPERSSTTQFRSTGSPPHPATLYTACFYTWILDPPGAGGVGFLPV